VTTPAITRLLVANRGEIARRVFATCRRLGIETVAVHSDPDAGLPYVAEADQAVRLPGAAPADTYLRVDAILDAARRTGADAVHPGYGFLSENAGFARAVTEAGLVWVGPSPESIEAMGSKVEAKRIMAEAGVPVLAAPEVPTEADLPLLIKASAGGGGRGMRIVRELGTLDDEIAAAEAEAASAFGDGTVFLEPYVEHSRHVEVQVWGTADGSRTVVVGARDCSIQRRHQKVVEEAPPPGFTAEQLAPLYDAARRAGKAIGYVGAGTVEFLVDADDLSRFWFLEMNTRLQVEHPVTEALTGLDLVELQLAAADPGSASVAPPVSVPELPERGHAIEVRLYAEDASYTPQSGLLHRVEVPDVEVEFDRLDRAGIRLDAGFTSGTEVSTHYDAMLAKVVAWGETRQAAARRLSGALRRARIHGPRTNRDQLVEILTSRAFLAGEVSTGLLAGTSTTEGPEGLPDPTAVAAALALAADDAARRTVQHGIPAGWRNVVSQPHRVELETDGGETVCVDWLGTRDGFVVDGVTVLAAVPAGSTDEWEIRLEVDGVATSYRVSQTRGQKSPGGGLPPREVWVDGPVVSARLREVPRFTDPADVVESGSLLAPMPGTVVKVLAEEGGAVVAGAPVLVLEAMKMQHTVVAPTDGTVTTINVAAGAQVAAGEVLAVVSENGDDQ